MTGKYFADTNLLVYSVESSDSEKRRVARGLLHDDPGPGAIVISIQVLQEFYWTATRKLRLDRLEARDITARWEGFEVVTMDGADVLRAIDISILHQVSFWDALIVAAAVKASCSVLLTEDMNHGQVINGVRIENPFRDIQPSGTQRVRESRRPYRAVAKAVGKRKK